MNVIHMSELTQPFSQRLCQRMMVGCFKKKFISGLNQMIYYSTLTQLNLNVSLNSTFVCNRNLGIRAIDLSVTRSIVSIEIQVQWHSSVGL